MKSSLNLLKGNSKEVKSSQYELESYINQSSDYAKKILSAHDISPIILGNGKTLIKQYTQAKTTVSSTTKVMLLTDGDKIEMPSMIGWSRKDAEAFASLAGVEIEVNGIGSIYEQSVSKGTILNSKVKIKVSAK